MSLVTDPDLAAQATAYITELREAGATKQSIADACGVHHRTVQNIHHGHHPASIDTARRVLAINPDTLTYREMSAAEIVRQEWAHMHDWFDKEQAIARIADGTGIDPERVRHVINETLEATA